jgi:integrase
MIVCGGLSKNEEPTGLSPRRLSSSAVMVGVAGFELATPCTPCKCATRLRYTPKPAIIARLARVSGTQWTALSRSRIS